MIKKVISLAALGGFGAMLCRFWQAFAQQTGLPAVSGHYIHRGPEELGSANIVTSVVVTYRGLDTLGEVSILFAAAAVVGLLLHEAADSKGQRREGSELLQTASRLLFPLILLFGAYIFVNGHRTPGGGFPGGAVLASALMLTILAYPDTKRTHAFIAAIESVSGVFYVIAGILGLVLAGGFLDTRILPAGPYGTLFSAGAIPVIYTLIGLKVGAELGSVLLHMNGRTGAKGEEA